MTRPDPTCRYIASHATGETPYPDVFDGTAYIVAEIATAILNASGQAALVMRCHGARDLEQLQAAHEQLGRTINQASQLSASLSRVVAFHLAVKDRR